MNPDFDRAVRFVFDHEGGYNNHPSDPGGETNYGISKRAYPNEDIPNMTEARAREIYYTDYWQEAGCELFPWPMSLVLFDTAVNTGVSRATRLLAESGVEWVDMLFNRLSFYSGLKKPEFMRGWTNRVVDLYWYAKKEVV